MAVNLGGYDDQSGWYPDDSTNNQFSDDVDLTGGRGSFGPGGFRANPRITGPASGPPPGVSLGTPGASGGAAAANTPNYTSPGQQPLRPGVSPAVRNGPGPSTDADVNSGGGGIWDRLKGFAPSIFGNPVAAGFAAPVALAAAGYKYGEPGAKQLSVDPRIDAAGSGGFDVQQPLGQPAAPVTPFTGGGIGGDARFPTATMPGQGGIGSDANAPLWGAGGFPTTYGQPGQQPPLPAGGPTGVNIPIGGGPGNAMQSPTGTPAVGRSPRRTPAAAGPAAVAQQPNMGAYDPNGRFVMIPRVNAPAGQSGGRGGGGGPMQTALNLSSLFGGGQPAAPAPAATARRPGAGAGPGRSPSGPVAAPPTYADPTIAAGGPGHGAGGGPPPTYADPTIAAGGPGHGARERFA